MYDLGALWTSIRVEEFQELGIDFGESVMVTIRNSQRMVYRQVLPYEVTFGKVPLGASVVYVNSMDRIGIAINQGSFFESVWDWYGSPVGSLF